MPLAGGVSAITAVGLKGSIGQQSGAYPPFSTEWLQTATLLSGECVLRAHSGHQRSPAQSISHAPVPQRVLRSKHWRSQPTSRKPSHDFQYSCQQREFLLLQGAVANPGTLPLSGECESSAVTLRACFYMFRKIIQNGLPSLALHFQWIFRFSFECRTHRYTA